MPIKISDKLPAKSILENENIFFMEENVAIKQDIRPLKILILNLMPKKIETETQLLRLLSNTPLQLEIELCKTATYQSRNTPAEHLTRHYKTFSQIKDRKFDGMIITGAPIENLEFEDVDYWEELKEIMEWTKTNVFSTIHICWGAQAGLYYHYGVRKVSLEKKMFGIFKHRTLVKNHPLLRGFDEVFFAPHSRHTDVSKEDIENNEKLTILSSSEEAGVYIASNRNGRRIFVTGHSEYDRNTLAEEYFRDLEKGYKIKKPVNYFPDDDDKKKPIYVWRGHSNLLFTNWLNYFVYQQTPYDLNRITKE